jgi:hypothetical protein
MRAASSPRFQPAQLPARHNALWFGLVLALALLGFAALLAVGALQGQPAEPQVVAPFRWLGMDSLG